MPTNIQKAVHNKHNLDIGYQRQQRQIGGKYPLTRLGVGEKVRNGRLKGLVLSRGDGQTVIQWDSLSKATTYIWADCPGLEFTFEGV